MFYILLGILLIFVIYNLFIKLKVLSYFKNGSVIVFGKKGSGKDVLFNYVTNNSREYYSNIQYTKKPLRLIQLNELTIGSNDFEKLINNNVEKIDACFKDNVDVFISDAGAHLPSQMDAYLHKKYKGMPLYYAMSRHLYKQNIHCNTQALERLWKSLREQADTYIKCLGFKKGFIISKLKIRIYDKYSTALNDIRPLKRNILKTETGNVHLSNTGEIKEYTLYMLTSKIKYDTRYFKKIFIK